MDIKYCLHCAEKCSSKFCAECSTEGKRREICLENAKVRHAIGLPDLVCAWYFNGIEHVMCGSQYKLAGLVEPLKKPREKVVGKPIAFTGSNFK